MSVRVQIVPFRRSQLLRIMAIESATFADEAYDKEMFLELYRNCSDLFFVAKRSGHVAGYMVTCAASGKAEIVSIAVHPKHRNTGVGKAMMEHTLKKLKARGVRRVELMVRSTSAASIRFYRSFGFSRVRRVARYYQDGGDAWRMKRLL
jgi:ribosomal-protein-alanine N-acetyltransferase